MPNPGQKVRASDFISPSCTATRSVAQTGIVTSTPTALLFDTEVEDNLGMFAPTSDTITIKRAGTYVVTGYGAIESNATGYRRLLIELNGGGAYVAIDQRPAVATDATHMTISATIPCGLNDTLKLFIEHSSGANRATVGTPRFSATYQPT